MMDQRKINTAIGNDAETLTNTKKISDLRFSAREFDVLACLLNNMTTKQIAVVLSLSTSTIESHIRSVITKIGCRSRKEIVEFIERADNNLLIREYCTKVSFKIAFEQELKKVATSNKNINIIIFYNKTNRAKAPLLMQLEKHLALAGITTTCKAWSKGKSIAYVNNNTKNLPDFIIYIIDDEILTKLNHAQHSLIKEASEIKHVIQKESDPIVFLFTDKHLADHPKDSFQEHIYLNASDHKNYYLLVFALLKILLPSYNFCTPAATFDNPQAPTNDVTFHPSRQKENKFSVNCINNSNYNYKNKILLGVVSIFLLLAIVVGITTNDLFHGKKQNNTLTNTSNSSVESQRSKNLFILPQRNSAFTGRKLILKKLKTILRKHHFSIITQTISGLGGVGKTQLAIEFAYQAANNNDYSAIFWIPAETSNSIYNAYQEIANHLQLDVKGMELGNIQTLVHNKLATFYKNTKILLILDNVPNYDFVTDYLAKTHKQLSADLFVNILVTSRSQHWPETPLILDIFTKKEAFLFVQRNLPNENAVAINQLTEALHYFPLALGQAVAYIKEHTNIDDYLKLYESKQKDFLNVFLEDKNQYNKSLWKTWNISIDKLSDPARDILFISAYLNPDDIPFSIFEHLKTNARANAVRELRKYSFITIISDKAFKIHRLLQEVIRISVDANSKHYKKNTFPTDLLKTNSYWLSKTINLINLKFDFDYLQPKQWGYWSKYLPHVQSIITNATAQNSIKQDNLKLYIKYAMFLLYIQNDIKHAITAWTNIRHLVQQAIKDNSAKLIIANINVHLSNAQSWLGTHREAISLLNTTIPIYHLPGLQISPNGRELLNLLRLVSFKGAENDLTRNSGDLNFALLVLSSVQYYLGSLQEALASCKQAAEVLTFKQADNISQFYLADTWGDLGNLHVYLGHFNKAKTLFEKSKQIIDKTFNYHPKQARLYADLALLEYNFGKFNKALTLLEACLKIRLKNFSVNHPQQEDTFLKLGFVNYMLGNTRAAKQNFLYAESIYKLYNDDDLIKVYINLGLWKVYESMQQYDSAMHYMKITLATAKLQFTNNLNLMISSQLSQAEIWPPKPTQTVLSYWQQAFDTSSQIFESSDYQIARSHYMLGLAFEYKHKTKEAHTHYKQAIATLHAQTSIHKRLKLFHIKNMEIIQERLQQTS